MSFGGQDHGFGESGFYLCFLSWVGSGLNGRKPPLIRARQRKNRKCFGAAGHSSSSSLPARLHSSREKSAKKSLLEGILEPLTPFFYLFLPGLIISSTELAQAMIEAAIIGPRKAILENNDIREIVQDGRKI